MATFRATARQRQALEAMEAARGDPTTAAAALGITTRSLFRLLENARRRNDALTNWDLAIRYAREDIQLMTWPPSLIAEA